MRIDRGNAYWIVNLQPSFLFSSRDSNRTSQQLKGYQARRSPFSLFVRSGDEDHFGVPLSGQDEGMLEGKGLSY